MQSRINGYVINYAGHSDSRQMTVNWKVYIILCSDKSLYTGITTDIEKRFSQHKEGSGAKYFRGRQPLQVVFLENDHCRSSAARREAQIKTMNRADKVLLVSQYESDSNNDPTSVLKCDPPTPMRDLQ